jgi:hypothetical protein
MPRHAAVRLYRRGRGPVNGGRRLLRRDGNTAGTAGKRGQERSGPRGARPGGAQGPVGRRQRWFGYTRIYANPDEPNHKKRHIVREDIDPAEAEAIRDAATRVLEYGESVGGFLSALVLSLGGRVRGCRAGSRRAPRPLPGLQYRSGNPCSARERRASAAACRTASRSSSLMAGCRAEMRRSVLVASFVPLPAYARLRADARAGGGTGQSAGRSLTVTAPRWPAHATVPG